MNGSLQGAAVWIAGANVENGGDAGGTGSLNDLFAITVKLRAVYVCMRINKHFLNLQEILGRPSDLLGSIRFRASRSLRAGRPRSRQITCVVALLRRLIRSHVFNDEPSPRGLALENDDVVSLQLSSGNTPKLG